MSDTGDTSIVAGTEPPAQTPQPVDPPQAESSPRRGSGWFKGGVRCGIIAAAVVVVAGAFFTIGWFTSTHGDDGRRTMNSGLHQQMNTGERGDRQGGNDERGTNQWQGYPNRCQGMVAPQQQRQGQPTQQGYLGVGVATVTPERQQEYGLSRSSGVLVASVDGSGSAFKAGVRQGDIITSLNGTPVTQQEDVVGLIVKMNAGDSVSVVIDRNGRSLTLQVTLAARPASISG